MTASTELDSSAVNTSGERKPRMPRFGVAIFDNDEDMTGGWASLAGAQEFRFRQPNDLPSDSIWITSIEGPKFRPLEKMHHLRSADFLRSKLKVLAADFGMATEGDDWARPAVRALSELANRTVLVAAQVYGWEDPLRMLMGKSLVEDIRKTMIRPNPVRPHMKAPLLSAHQIYSSPEVGSGYLSDSIFLNLRLNRLAHAKKIMSTMVPDGAWSYSGREEGNSFDYSVEAALRSDKPSLVEATVETSRTDPEISSLVAFGSSLGKRNGLRSWISQPELKWLSQHAKVTINRIYQTHGSKPLPERMQLPELLVSDPLYQMSVSVGLVAECHWSAIANRTYNSLATIKEEVSVWGVWLRAVDRAICFDLALKAHKAGFSVRGYGTGSVLVSLQRSRLHELLEFSMENGIAHPSFREVFERNGLA